MMSILEAIEFSAFAEWIRSGHWIIYTSFLAAHTIGLIFLVGLSVGISMRILGVAPELPLAPLAKYFPLMVAGFWVNAVTGVVLVIAAAQTFLTSPVFWLKMAAIAVGLVSARWLYMNVYGPRASLGDGPVPTKARAWAWTSLVAWGLAILMGRMTAYSMFVVISSVQAVLVFAVVMIAGGYIVLRVFGRKPVKL